ncbi:hypothetical protein B0H13DRAFT_1923815 [Mycena leptocephala]|nr:hypothetical protein B0H13DRAFT_1923815 [Mycena leptocephala]
MANRHYDWCYFELEHLVDLQLDLGELHFDRMGQSCNMLALKNLSLPGSLQSILGFMDKFRRHRAIDDTELLPLVDMWRELFVICAGRSSSISRIIAHMRGAHHTTNLIESFIANDFYSISLTDQDIACAWPALNMLILPHSPGNNAPSAAALHAFAKHCPKLNFLYVSVHPREQLLKVQNLGLIPHPLPNLAINFHPVASPEVDVLDLSLAIFPNIRFQGATVIGDDDERWNSVARLLAQFHAQQDALLCVFHSLNASLVYRTTEYDGRMNACISYYLPCSELDIYPLVMVLSGFLQQR